MRDIKITIITVCRNAEKVLEKTIQSVITQTYKNIEYIIIDGASTDHTLQIIKQYEHYKNMKYISEPDQGLYYAMNKGIDLAQGEFIQFLNAGDSLVDDRVVEKVVQFIKKNRGDIFYGSIIYKYDDGREEKRNYGRLCAKRYYYYTGDCINHQAIFAHKETLKNHKFDTSFKMCADREWMMRMMKKKYICMPIVICRYSLNELSQSVKNKIIVDQEASMCIKKYCKEGYLFYCLFEKMRENGIFSKLLHSIYRLIYIKK